MPGAGKATRIDLFSFHSAPMRAFHVTWVAFFLAFFGWFGIAPLMPLVREDLGLSKEQVGNIIIASVAATIFVRLLMGWLCDRIGPRLAYSGLLVLGSLPVMGIGLADSYETFLLARLGIGAIGAAFVITQYHTSVMFAPSIVGTANATTAGWGNMGGGFTQMLMPVVLAGVLALGVPETLGWRVAMVVPGVALLIAGIAYYRLTQDTPQGNFKDLRAAGLMPPAGRNKHGSLRNAARDHRVWALFLIYGACFGVELTIHNVAALYYFDRFGMDLKTAGLLAGSFGALAIFARALGGWLSDLSARTRDLPGRVWVLGLALLGEGIALIAFSRMGAVVPAFFTMLAFGLCVHMACGATFGVVPFVNRQALGSVSGIVGAGGNAGAVAAGFLFRSEALATADAFLYLGLAVLACAALTLTLRFDPARQTSRGREGVFEPA